MNRILLIVVAFFLLVLFFGYVVVVRAEEAREAAANAKVRQLETAVDLYRLNNNEPPANLETLLQRDPNNGGVAYLRDKDSILDPWGNKFQYRYELPAGPEIWSTTPSGRRVGTPKPR